MRRTPSRSCRRALSGAGLLLAGLLLLSAAWSDDESSAVKGMEFLRESRDARRYVRPLTSTALLTPPPGSAAAAACNAPPMGPGPGVASFEANDPLAAQLAPAPPLRLLMLVTSAPAHHERRQAIRETWGGRSEDARLVFVLGRGPEPATEPSSEVMAEAQRHGDLLVEDFTDAYYNLTLKTLFLLNGRCAVPSRVLLKRTTTCFIQHAAPGARFRGWCAGARGAPTPPGLHAARRGRGRTRVARDPTRPSPRPRLIFALVHHPRAPLRHPNPMYLPRWLFPDDVLPDFVSGTAYVMSRPALEHLYSVALNTPLLPLEDVFLTGVVGGSRLGIPRVHISRFWPHNTVLKPPKTMDHPCLYHHMLAMHHFTAEKLRHLWNPLMRLQPARQCDTYLMRFLGRLFSPGSYQVVTDDPW
ncbi:Beta-1,3-galactosyltransferase brn [Gryllus bimaculatus]|nr:Beta-1,3-galactosyltransferase brn [Gryllus bimaculatus]